jgi:hypothetical protein
MRTYDPLIIGCYEGWEQLAGNPVLSGRLGQALAGPHPYAMQAIAEEDAVEDAAFA